MLAAFLTTAALAQVALGAVHSLGQGDQCLQVSGGSPSNGSPVTLGACNSGNQQMQPTGQQWIISPGNNAGVQLLGSNLCLDAGPNPTAGRALTVALCQSSATQQWYLTDDNRIAVTGGTQCLQSDGTTARSQACGPGITEQAWTPTFLFDTPTSATSSASASASSASGAAGGVVGGIGASASSATSMASSMASSAVSSGASAASGASQAASSGASGASSAASGAASGASSAASGAASGASSVASGAGSAAGAATSGAGSVAGAATSGAGSVAGAATSGAGSVAGGASSVAGSVAGAASSAVTPPRSAGFATSHISGGLIGLMGALVGAALIL